MNVKNSLMSYFIYGLMAGACFTAAAVTFRAVSLHDNCAEEHNVYACELTYTPLKETPPK